MAIINAQLTNAVQDILTTPAGKNYAITCIFICNSSWQHNANFDMHLIPTGTAIDDEVTRMINDLQLAPRETFTLDTEKIVLGPGDKISFFARPALGPDDGSSSNLTDLAVCISYIEV